ncbi:MAG: TetR family transcriptional regulator [Hamadaea sp.]|nr:TetR family transcriptional regulator [Hamadaea sp.]
MARMAVADRRAALIQAAIRVIAAEGVAAATTRAITAEAGMSLASFHYAFRSRDELIAELIPFVVADETAAAAATLADGVDLTTALRLGLTAFLDLVAAAPARELAMLELTQYALRTDTLAETAKAQYARYHEAAGALAEAAAHASDRTWRRPLPEIARILVTFTDGLTLDWLVHRDTDASRRVVEFAAAALAALAAPAEEGA